MATCQKVRPTKVATVKKPHSSVFKQNPMKTFVESEKFVKQVVAMSVSDIFHSYKMFSTEMFETRTLGGVSIKVLRPVKTKPDYQSACTLLDWMKGAFDALEKRYLKSLILGVAGSETEEDEVEKSFTYNFKYSNEGILMKVGDQVLNMDPQHSLDNIVQATLGLFKSSAVAISSSENLQKDDNMNFTMKLIYHEGTPEDYEPPNFKAAKSHKLKFAADPAVLQLGSVNSPFHGINVVMHLDKKYLSLGADLPQKLSTSATPNSTISSSPTSCLASNNNNAAIYHPLVPNRVFVGGLSADMAEAEMESLFSGYGTVSSVKMIRNQAGVSKGCLITYETEEQARNLLRMQEVFLKNRKFTITPAIKNQPESYGRGSYDLSPSPSVSTTGLENAADPSSDPAYANAYSGHPHMYSGKEAAAAKSMNASARQNSYQVMQTSASGSNDVDPKNASSRTPLMELGQKKGFDINYRTTSSNNSVMSNTSVYTRCTCGFPMMPGPLVRCSTCGLSQHSLCYGILGECTHHCCIVCRQKPSRLVVPPSNLEQETAEQIIALYRNILVLSTSLSRIYNDTFQKHLFLDDRTSEMLLDKLVVDRIAIVKKGRAWKTINQERLLEIMYHYFSTSGVKGGLIKVLKRLKPFQGLGSSQPFAARKFISEYQQK